MHEAAQCDKRLRSVEPARSKLEVFGLALSAILMRMAMVWMTLLTFPLTSTTD